MKRTSFLTIGLFLSAGIGLVSCQNSEVGAVEAVAGPEVARQSESLTEANADEGAAADPAASVDPDSTVRAADQGGQPSAIDIIHRRKSVRSYTDEPVSREHLETLVRAGMAAPTGGNRQPWVFMVIADREKLVELGELIPPGRMLADAQAAIMVGGVPEWGIRGEVNAYWVQDTSAATQNILLAVEALDLGAVWIGIHPRESRETEVRDALGLPEEVVPLNLIAIGHPTGEEEPKDKWKPHRVHWEQWSSEQFETR